MTAPRCHDLRVEHQTEPLGLGIRRPRFSWTVDAPVTGFELEVRDGDLLLEHRRLGADEQVLVRYAGPELASDHRYTWRVRALADAGSGPWSDASFTTGILDPTEWTASWVRPRQEPALVERWTLLDWIQGRGPQEPPAERLRPVQLLRQRFRVRPGLRAARLYSSAHGVIAAEIDGRPVDDTVLAPGFDSYRHRLSVGCADVTALLREGDNVLGIALADGWWAGRIGLTGSSAQFGRETSAIWELRLHYADGGADVVASGHGVRSRPGPWDYADLFVGERYDARRAARGWSSPEEGDTGWEPVEPTDEDRSPLTMLRGEPVRRVAELTPASLRTTAEGVIVDFGQVIAGRVRVRLPGVRAGQEIVLEHTEALTADGAWFENIVGIDKDQRDVYIAAGVPGERYEPTFTFHGFRYCRIRGLDATPDPADVRAIVVASDLRPTGELRLSHPGLDRLHRNAVWSQRGNFVSIPTDCPQRERAGWTGDIQVFAPAATHNAGVATFLARWLDNLRADQLPDGRIPITSPRSPVDAATAENAPGIGGIVTSAGWSDAIVFVPWTLYERYGDVGVLEENVDAMRRFVEQRDAAGSGTPALEFGDWLAPSTLEGGPLHERIAVAPELTGPLIAPMFQAQSLTLLARIVGVLGRSEEQARLEERARAVRARFAARHVDADGRLPVELQGVYVLALAFDMVPAGVRDRTVQRLVALVEERGDRLDTGFLSVPYLLDVLWEAGHRDLARRVLLQRRGPSWLYEVDHGATTIWESWDGIAPDGSPHPTSYNHYAFGCVDDWMYRRIAGIRPATPGYREAVLEPDVDGGLEAAAAHVTTPYGRLAIDWRRTGGAVVVETEVPVGVAATLRLDGRDRPLAAGRTRVEVRP